MAEYIEKQAAINALHGYFDGMLETDTWSPCDVYGLIEILPSAQPEIVRCKDCVHYDLAKNGYNGQCNRQYATFYADDFCSYGER